MQETPEIENNNINNKPLHGKINMDSINLGESNNPLQKSEISETSFNFLQPKDTSIAFDVSGAEIEDVYVGLKTNCKFVICILAKDDTYFSSSLLKDTLFGIQMNISIIKKLIEPENLLICVFFNEIKGNSIFNESDKLLLNNKLNYILSRKTYEINSGSNADPINIHCFGKNGYFSSVEILKFYYTYIIKQLKPDNNIIISSVITNGVVPTNNSFDTLLKISFYSRQTHSIVVPLIEDAEATNLFGKIKLYERMHFNIFNMNFYNMTSAVPISSLFNIMIIDDRLSAEFLNFYLNIHNEATIDYHDYNLSLYLYRSEQKIIYYNRNPMGAVYYKNESENPISNYKKYWVERYSGYYGNFFGFINTFLDFKICLPVKKFFLFFYIIGMMIEFIYPSLSYMVIYTIFYEAFDTYDIFPAAFCTTLYLVIVICSGVNSLISKDTQKTYKSNLIFYFFMEIYYLFILICSIIAMDNINKNKKNDTYKFNKAAISLIIIFTFIPSIIPILIKSGKFVQNIVPMILYLFLGAPSSSSIFNICKILNASDSSGGSNAKEKKGVYIIVYFLINLFFGAMTFYNYNRQRRVDAVMGFGIFYMIYNLFKMIAIMLSLLNKDSDSTDVSNSAIKNNLFSNVYQNKFGSEIANQSNSINNNSDNNNNYNSNDINNDYGSNIDNDIN